MKVSVTDGELCVPPPKPIVEHAKKRTREAYAAIIRPDYDQVEFVKMPQTISLKDISVRISRYASAQYVAHAAEVDDYQFYAYVDENAQGKKSRPNELGATVASLLGFDMKSGLRGTIVFVGPPVEGAGTCGQPFDDRTKAMLEKKLERLKKR